MRENTVKSIWGGGAAAVDNSLLVNPARAVGGAMRKGNLTEAKSISAGMS